MSSPAVMHAERYGKGFWVRLVALMILNAMAVYALVVLYTEGAWGFLASLIVGTLFINWVYFSKKTAAMRWIAPGLVLMLIFVVWPILFSVYIAFTNWSTGNILTKDQAVEQLESLVVPTDPDDAEEFDYYLYGSSDDLYLLLITEDGSTFYGPPRLQSEEPNPDALLDFEAAVTTDDDGDGIPETIDGRAQLQTRDLFGIANIIEELVLDLPQGQVLPQTISAARLVVDAQRYVYDPDSDVLFDSVTGVNCTPEAGNFICDGARRDPGWRVVVGADNFADIVGNDRIRGPLLRVFVWNFAFAALSVILTLGLGLLIAMTVRDREFKGRALYRSILIIPYALPAFISALVWRGLFNRDFGQINSMLEPIYNLIGSEPLNWLGDPTLAKVAVLIVNLWLGFPYMFLITLGALQSIPKSLEEAAIVDGASPRRAFRSVTFPLLMVSIAPLLIGSFAFNFNNFVLIFLMTQGGPPVLGSTVPVGHTDILISFTFDVAVQAGRGNNFGLGSALTIMIFLLVAIFSAIGFRYTRKLEDVFQ
ncbi:MAG: maltose ABC transporter permease MalF [Acidimicrobiia bacterium]|nr:maltose ABC transporter permease MalF [Acidimicrobiia bacterium]